MTIFKWSNRLENGIRAFDEEHKFLVETLNNVYELLKKGKRDDAKKLLMESVVNYAVKHFSHEEEIMVKYNYPEYENHKKIHEIFVRLVVEKLVPQIENGSEKDFNNALSFLIGWLEMHIAKSDKEFSAYLLKNGITLENEEPVKI